MKLTKEQEELKERTIALLKERLANAGIIPKEKSPLETAIKEIRKDHGKQ